MDNATYSEQVVRAVRGIIEERGASLLGVASATGIAYATLHRRLHTPNSPFTVVELAAIADYFGVHPRTLTAPGEDAA